MISAFWLGAKRVIAIDRFPDRLRLAADFAHVETINYEEEDVFTRLKDTTHGRGPDACIDAVGMEAHGTTLDARYDRIKHAMYLATDRPHVLRQAIHACRKGGRVSVPGVYGGFLDKVPFGAAFGKGLTFRMGQTHVHRYVPMLAERVARGDVDPARIISHRARLEDAPQMYEIFRDKVCACTKVVLTP
jgi:threonine dehydrogenase-like Zn-dependent dehydrogenase